MEVLDNDLKRKIVTLKEVGKSGRWIAKKLGLPKTTVSDFLSKNTHKEFWAVHDSIEPPEGVSVLIIDIETSPILSWHWGLFKQNIAPCQIAHDWQILCFSAKWLGSDTVISHDARGDYPVSLFGDNSQEQQKEMMAACWELLNRADLVVAHNGKKFDQKKINTKFLEFGFVPPSQYKVVDTLNIVKSNFGAPTNKLEYWTKFLGQEGKLKNDGMPMWIGCMKGNKTDWDNMVTYCDQDVGELEEFYLSIRGWDRYHPSVGVFFDDGVERCTKCGGQDLSEEKGKVTTNLSKFVQLRCNTCGGLNYRRGNTRSKESMKAALVAVK